MTDETRAGVREGEREWCRMVPGWNRENNSEYQANMAPGRMSRRRDDGRTAGLHDTC